MPDDKLIQYFIQHSNERFDKLEEKVDQLIGFRVMLIGAAAGVSGLVATVFNVVVVLMK